MLTDSEIRIRGLQALTNALGKVDAEKFIALIMREPFDYTKWQETLWEDKSVSQISAAAMRFRNQAKKEG